MIIPMDTPTTIFTIALLVILILQGLGMAQKKKRDKEAARKYQAMESRLNEASAQNGRTFDDAYLFITDQEQGIKLCVDSKEHILAIVMESDYAELPFSTLRSCAIHEETDGNTVQRLSVRVETDDQRRDYLFASQARKKGSYVENLVRTAAQEMVAVVQKHIPVNH